MPGWVIQIALVTCLSKITAGHYLKKDVPKTDEVIGILNFAVHRPSVFPLPTKTLWEGGHYPCVRARIRSAKNDV